MKADASRDEEARGEPERRRRYDHLPPLTERIAPVVYDAAGDSNHNIREKE
jgi:hypothetical protein